MEMNLQLHHVVSDITGTTGMRIIRAIAAGERDPDVLASFRDVRCHSSVETIRAALVGNDRDEHVFALAQSLELYDAYQAKMVDCDRKLEAAVAALTVKASGSIPPLPKARMKGRQVNAPSFDVRAALHGVLGVDLTQIHGLGPSLALKLVAECGTDLTAWPSAKHFTSWRPSTASSLSSIPPGVRYMMSTSVPLPAWRHSSPGSKKVLPISAPRARATAARSASSGIGSE